MGHIRVKVGRLADHEKKLLVSKSLITQDDLNDLAWKVMIFLLSEFAFL